MSDVVVKRGRPRQFTEEEQREKRLAAQKVIRDKRPDALIKWRTESSTQQQQLLILLKDTIITDPDVIELMGELVNIIQGN